MSAVWSTLSSSRGGVLHFVLVARALATQGGSQFYRAAVISQTPIVVNVEQGSLLVLFRFPEDPRVPSFITAEKAIGISSAGIPPELSYMPMFDPREHRDTLACFVDSGPEFAKTSSSLAEPKNRTAGSLVRERRRACSIVRGVAALSWAVSESQIDDVVMEARSSILRKMARLEAGFQPILTFDVETFQAKRKLWRLGSVDDAPACVEVKADNRLFGHDIGEFLLGLEQVIFQRASLLRNPGSSASIVNIGASNGRDGDPLWPTASRLPVVGLYIEGDEPSCSGEQALEARPDPSRIEFLCGTSVSPENMGAILEHARMFEGLPRGRSGMLPSLDMVKIDIDTCDCEVAVALLRAVERVLVLVMEVNPFPPPLAYAFRGTYFSTSPDWNKLDIWPLHGCSLTHQVRIFADFGLKLYRYTGQDAIFVHESLWDFLMGESDSRFGFDEFACFEASEVVQHRDIPMTHTQEWFFKASALEALSLAAGNLTSIFAARIASGGMPSPAGLPFTLGI